MKKPLTNDFDMPISRDTARRTLEAAGWVFDTSDYVWFLTGGNEGIGYTLREAWELHKRGEV
jgi:hypothetical protein